MTHRQPRSDAGYTLVEIMITSALLLAVLAIVLPLVVGSLNTFTNTQVRSDATDNAQVALSQIGHDVVSSNFLYIDSSGPVPVVHLQTYGTAGSSTCVEYQVQYPAAPADQIGVLQRRTRAPGIGAAWPNWSTITTGIVNSTQAGTPPVFTNPASSQLKSLVVNLWVRVDTRAAATAAAPANFNSIFTGPAIPASAAATASPSTAPC